MPYHKSFIDSFDENSPRYQPCHVYPKELIDWMLDPPSFCSILTSLRNEDRDVRSRVRDLIIKEEDYHRTIPMKKHNNPLIYQQNKPEPARAQKQTNKAKEAIASAVYDNQGFDINDPYYLPPDPNDPPAPDHIRNERIAQNEARLRSAPKI